MSRTVEPSLKNSELSYLNANLPYLDKSELKEESRLGMRHLYNLIFIFVRENES